MYVSTQGPIIFAKGTVAAIDFLIKYLYEYMEVLLLMYNMYIYRDEISQPPTISSQLMMWPTISLIVWHTSDQTRLEGSFLFIIYG